MVDAPDGKLLQGTIDTISNNPEELIPLADVV